MTQPKDTSELVAELRSLMERATQGTWSWEDNPPTVYAGRVDPMGEFGGMPICGHGYNLFGRLTDISHNGRADLDLAVAAVNALPTLLDELVNAYRIIGERREEIARLSEALVDDPQWSGAVPMVRTTRGTWSKVHYLENGEVGRDVRPDEADAVGAWRFYLLKPGSAPALAALNPSREHGQ